LFPNSQAVKRSNNNNRANASNPSAALQSMLAEGLERGGPLSAAEQQQVLAQQLQPKEYVRELRFAAVTDNYMRQMPRRWKTGDVYAPRDLSPTEMDKWRQARPPETDVVDMFGFNPLDNYKVRAFLSNADEKRTKKKRRGEKLTKPPPPRAELRAHLGIHDHHGPHQALQRHGAAARQPAQDGQGDPPRHRHGPAPQRALPPGDPAHVPLVAARRLDPHEIAPVAEQAIEGNGTGWGGWWARAEAGV
jgi:small subunit ribosomal protein S18